jgi:hypothetical protein
MTSMRNRAIRGLGKIYSFLMLQKVVHVLTTGLQKVLVWKLFVHYHPESFIFPPPICRMEVLFYMSVQVCIWSLGCNVD